MRVIFAVFLLGATTSSTALAETAVVNTPGDGYLALRSEPSTSRGARLYKIPHATRLTVGECVLAPNTDRWCKTTFNGQSGWVFDRFLTRESVRSTNGSGGKVQTLPVGDPVRKGILDAIRAEYSRPVVFKVHDIKVSSGWAWTTVTATINGAESYEPGSYLTHNERGKWRVVGSVDGAGEESIVEAQYVDLRRRFPEVPPGIFD